MSWFVEGVNCGLCLICFGNTRENFFFFNTRKTYVCVKTEIMESLTEIQVLEERKEVNIEMAERMRSVCLTRMKNEPQQTTMNKYHPLEY